jgi:hypothetical protein
MLHATSRLVALIFVTGVAAVAGCDYVDPGKSTSARGPRETIAARTTTQPMREENDV